MDTRTEPEAPAVPGDAAPPWRSAAALGLVALVGTALLAGVAQLTGDRIALQEQRAVLRQLNEVLPQGRYDNELHADVFTLADEEAFPGRQAVTVYRARLRGAPVAVVFRLLAPDGYSGPIHLLVGVNADGSLSGVRVTSHRETPGLGDFIERERSEWVLDFDGRSLRAPEPERWTVRRDGGDFDQFTGATITPRAVVAAVRRTLQFFAANRELLFNHPAEGPEAGNGGP